jgi:predicted nucleic acid-binding protein
MEYALDADWVINALAKKRRADEVLKRLGPAGIGISIVTLGELYEGPFGTSHPEPNLASLREFLTLFTVLELTDPMMERFARIRHQLRSQGNLIPDFDLIIAATALEFDLTVLTFNVRHFSRIEGLAIHQMS